MNDDRTPCRTGRALADDFRSATPTRGRSASCRALKRGCGGARSGTRPWALTADPDESRAITPALLRIEGQIQSIQSDLTAATTDPTGIAPPTPADVAAIQQVADQLDRMTAVQRWNCPG